MSGNQGTATISTCIYAKGLGIPFFAKFSVFNFASCFLLTLGTIPQKCKIDNEKVML